MYTVNFNTGAGNQCFDDLDDAKAYADKDASYTQSNIDIIDNASGEIVCSRRWYDVAYDSNDDDCEDGDGGIIDFGSIDVN